MQSFSDNILWPDERKTALLRVWGHVKGGGGGQEKTLQKPSISYWSIKSGHVSGLRHKPFVVRNRVCTMRLQYALIYTWAAHSLTDTLYLGSAQGFRISGKVSH